ncbi:MAG: hypothetical protein E4H28_07240 [Gemmatimonadales bacterium]|nr:MAG: hypothetical protein E4H28_07240 [Gemmatimonadales bacterium]
MARATYLDRESVPARIMREREQKVIELARVDQAVFNRFVFGIVNQPFHDYMNALADKHRYTTFDAPVEHGKTVQFSICRIAREIGLDPFHTIANMSSTPLLPKRSLAVVRQTIEENENYHKVFPKVRLKESTKETLVVERKGGVVKDPTLRAMGIEGNILGSRWSLLITDDMLRFNTTWTEHERKKVWRRFTGECQGRLEADSRHIDIGTPWTITDARHLMRKLDGYLFLRFDGWTGRVYDINNKLVKEFPGGGLWPKYYTHPVTGKRHGWPKERLLSLKKRMPGHEFARQIECVALSAAMAIFDKHLRRCAEIGEGIEMSREDDGDVRIAWRHAHPSWRYIFTGVDLAIDKQSTSADTAFFTGAVEASVKHPLELRRGKIEGPDILRQMIYIVRRYPMHCGFRVESNAGQMYIKQFADEPGLLQAIGASDSEAAKIRGCIQAHFTGANKADNSLGIRAMTADFERGRWVIPQMDGEQVDVVSEWTDSLKNFDPTGHPDYMLMASWLFWEECRGHTGNSDWDKFGVHIP